MEIKTYNVTINREPSLDVYAITELSNDVFIDTEKQYTVEANTELTFDTTICEGQ